MLLGGLIGLSAGLLPELTQVHTRFEFMYSFKGPYLIDSKGNIPFWNYGGSKYSYIEKHGNIIRDVRFYASLKSVLYRIIFTRIYFF